MSVEAISWALNLAPVPTERSGQPSSASKFVLVGLANHASPDGSGAFPSVRTLTRYTGLSERTVRSCLDRLEASGLIRPCDPAVVAAKIKRADRRPQGWDLDLAQVRADFDATELQVLEHQFPGLRARIAAAAAGAAVGGPTFSGVQQLHPVGSLDNSGGEVQRLHPAVGTGCSDQADGVQPATPRGAALAPEPSKEPSREPSATSVVGYVCESGLAGLGGGASAEFFAALGEEWKLTAMQEARLGPAVTAAIDSGWTPRELAAWTGANTTNIRSPYAVLASRLSPAELSAPPRPQLAWPQWCRQCDERTRLLGFDSDAPRPCPSCRRRR